MKRSNPELIVGLDIGTSKVACIVAQSRSGREAEIIGVGQHPSRGLKKGVVVDIESTVQAITRAVQEAELMAGVQIHGAVVGIAGGHIRGYNSHGIVAIKNKEVSNEDVGRVMDAARAIVIPQDQNVIHILPQEFMIDSQEGVHEPVGMSGVRLEARVHIVTGAVSAAQNITKCVERCGLHVQDLVLEQLASADAVLTTDEKELGVCLVDIGGGTTDIAIFRDGAVRHTAVIPIAGDQVTNDIALGLRTPPIEAEQIKKLYGCALGDLIEQDDEIPVPSVGTRPPRTISRRILGDIIEPRIKELFELIQAELRRTGYEDLVAAGVVITGGSSKLEGIAELAEEILHLPVRIGEPMHLPGMETVVRTPGHATGVGLVMYGLHNQVTGQAEPSQVPAAAYEKHMDTGFGGIFNKMRSWVQTSFG
ncbi:cell division protein FtsA [Acidithiobacillus ferrianus]|uniref:Cell division protein FtsA n=2 Tax=Acidithiobacillus ferrianus TaxID=2678518 RepID=A0A845U6H5_9PROT|nr:cell division protein FtsA [Acidithiobacillus ferrianus]NDU41125.1 cell division protein FtsA [Acidithiobacillus ferrianus]